MEIKASNTPLKRYLLICPDCKGENIVLSCCDPEEPYCNDCDNEIDVIGVTEFIENWLEYLQDRIALLETEKQEKQNQDKKGDIDNEETK